MIKCESKANCGCMAVDDWDCIKRERKKCVLGSTEGDNRVIHTACEDASKVVGQLHFGSFTRLRLTITPTFRKLYWSSCPIESPSNIDTLSTCAKGSMGLKDQYAVFNSY